MTYYSRPITNPATKRDGLANFIQMVINKLEAGETNEALLTAVDLLEDVRCGTYDEVIEPRIQREVDAIVRQSTEKHHADIIKATEAGIAEGVAAEKARMARLLGVAA